MAFIKANKRRHRAMHSFRYYPIGHATTGCFRHFIVKKGSS